MGNSSRIKLSSLNQEGLPDVIQTLETVFQACEVDFYVIGALARDTWLGQENIKTRTTKDVDLAVFVSNLEQYETIRTKLIEDHNFRAISTNDYALLTPFGYPVDLLPFGSIEIDDAVELEGEQATKVHVNGFKEVYQEGVTPVTFEEGFNFKVASLPSIVLLKLISFDDRPEHRTRDIRDIGLILAHYFDIESMLIYEKHNDLFAGEEIELIEIAATVIGRELRPILSQNQSLKNRFISILNISEKHHQRIPELLAQNHTFTIDEATALLQRIKNGIQSEKL